MNKKFIRWRNPDNSLGGLVSIDSTVCGKSHISPSSVIESSIILESDIWDGRIEESLVINSSVQFSMVRRSMLLSVFSALSISVGYCDLLGPVTNRDTLFDNTLIEDNPGFLFPVEGSVEFLASLFESIANYLSNSSSGEVLPSSQDKVRFRASEIERVHYRLCNSDREARLVVVNNVITYIYTESLVRDLKVDDIVLYCNMKAEAVRNIGENFIAGDTSLMINNVKASLKERIEAETLVHDRMAENYHQLYNLNPFDLAVAGDALSSEEIKLSLRSDIFTYFSMTATKALPWTTAHTAEFDDMIEKNIIRDNGNNHFELTAVGIEEFYSLNFYHYIPLIKRPKSGEMWDL